ncbi:hypothetical protein PHYBLDRAFT_62187 [Phycomyces blakesleeanus NRRL 1555(-)]|uniref:DDE Tnp4 domain-containing protein n=1 Tax=Phycomyces blakesleeanus (strain ATCC 8743b / DSM 1359 / FGSC 10004 / NBRC 33097 / NRRL 1555) TaxID=763407 RepID=A0A167Q4B2_PHYB8|nr:hypothetical protein PHYBLDRAFT_62187 [Phycomyces blakesleeanus NRRL 1555(-)]OAD79049.1 hypothetical protein PHYBLDRAFT_62187 [Phycomyces blakesleeanus NRRL 1555(-)]|eukprot:XP_018297089.1 hypothetical protein PHYBLDRAFT_62187 [Phycomyces blakesleeanus NRRL 1555(-)]
MPFNSHINNIAKVLELSEQAFRDDILGETLDQADDQTEALELLHIQEAKCVVISLCQQDHLGIHTVPTEECKCLFRLTYTEIQSIYVLFKMRDKVCIEKGCSTLLSVPVTEALAIQLHLLLLFGRNSTDISRISNHVMCLLHLKFGRVMIFDYCQFDPKNLGKFSNAIRALGPPVEHCVRFLDSTFKETARPTENQKTIYSGQGLNYQAVVTPNRITSSFYGLVAGRHHGMTVFYESSIEMHMRKALDFRSIGRPYYHLYADREYAFSEFVMRPFAETKEDSPEYIGNQDMSSARVVVEKEFAHVENLFAYVNYAQTQRILQGNVSSYYIVATLFKNLYVCYNRRNQTSMRFKASSPTPMEYIAGLLNH